MKKKIHAQQHPNQEDKSGNAVYASLTSVNSSTNQPLAHDLIWLKVQKAITKKH